MDTKGDVHQGKISNQLKAKELVSAQQVVLPSEGLNDLPMRRKTEMES